MVSFRPEMDVKYVLFNALKELLVKQEVIKFKTKFDNFIDQTRKELLNQIVKTNNRFSTWNGILGMENGRSYQEF